MTPELVQDVYADYFYGLGMMAVVMIFVTLMLAKVIDKMIAKGNAIQAEEDKMTGMQPAAA